MYHISTERVVQNFLASCIGCLMMLEVTGFRLVDCDILYINSNRTQSESAIQSVRKIMSPQKLPVGIQTFSEIIGEDYLYVDKTPFISLYNGYDPLVTCKNTFGSCSSQ